MASLSAILASCAAAFLLAHDVPPLTPAVPPTAQTRTFIVINRTLHSVTGRLESLRGRQASVLPSGPGAQRVQIPDTAAVIDADRWGPGVKWNGAVIGEDVRGETGTLVELTDGTLLAGDLLPPAAAGKDDRLVLAHKTLGHIPLTLDSIRRLVPAVSSVSPSNRPTPRKDTLRFVNEDTLEGFIAGVTVGGSGGALRFEHDGQKTLVELSRLREVRFASPPAKERVPAVWFSDGSNTTFLILTMDETEVRIQRDQDSVPAVTKPAAVTAALLDPAVLVPLSPPTHPLLRTGPPEPLGTRDLTLTEPGTVVIPLPDGTARIAGWLVLPEDCRAWGDAEVTMNLDAQPLLLKETINAARPEVAFNLELPKAKGMKLRVTLTEGKYGPIQDRVTLRHVLLAK